MIIIAQKVPPVRFSPISLLPFPENLSHLALHLSLTPTPSISFWPCYCAKISLKEKINLIRVHSNYLSSTWCLLLNKMGEKSKHNLAHETERVSVLIDYEKVGLTTFTEIRWQKNIVEHRVRNGNLPIGHLLSLQLINSTPDKSFSQNSSRESDSGYLPEIPEMTMSSSVGQFLLGGRCSEEWGWDSPVTGVPAIDILTCRGGWCSHFLLICSMIDGMLRDETIG